MTNHILARDLATNEPKVFAATETLANRYPCFRLGCRIYRFDQTIRLDGVHQSLDESWLEEHACECPKHIKRLNEDTFDTHATTFSRNARESRNIKEDDMNGGHTAEGWAVDKKVGTGKEVLGGRTPEQIEAEIERRLAAGETPESIRYDHRGCGCDRPIEASAGD